ncbi:uncharacterized protein LOC132394738 isoform X2 [Hypanus sabinus]|uniref:uncharacterized protein LOC132394738 isoform X2 n=1 Tax=Hypanus sabinus TaxID=79690 RepID=UPI0028C3EF98|nr:uncharacterized protein LOC132394738 isoform X2 [Hypanus sabinus]
MWLRAWFSLLCLLHVCSQLHPMALSVQYIFAGRYSSVLLEGYSGSELQKGSMIKWSLVLRDRISLMVLHVIGSPNIRYSDYYIHRIDYNTRNGSLTLNNIDLDDRGIYENTITTYGETVQKSYYIKVLDVRDVLIAPVIIQNPKNAVRIAQLTCVTNSWDTDTILWYKGSKLLETDEIYSMSTDNRTLTIKTDQVANCELFTCVIENKVSQSKNSHVLIINGLLLLHRYTFITSIIALVSTSTSFAASIFIIFFALGTYRVHKRHVQLTAVFVLFQLLSFISLLTAALFCVFDPDFPIPYRIIDVLGLFLVIAMIIYILVLYLHPETKLKRSFLIKTNHRYFFLVYGSLSVIISAAPIYRGYNNTCRRQRLNSPPPVLYLTCIPS